MPVTKDQAEQLATLACAARPTGAPRWHPAGVMTALAKVNHLDLAEVIKTVGRAAGDRTLDTPAAIGNPATPCWIERPIERTQPDKTTPLDRCGVCGKARDRCVTAPRFAGDDHAFEPDFKTKRAGDVIEIVEALKAELITMREPTHTEDRPTTHLPAADAARAALHQEPTDD